MVGDVYKIIGLLLSSGFLGAIITYLLTYKKQIADRVNVEAQTVKINTDAQQTASQMWESIAEEYKEQVESLKKEVKMLKDDMYAMTKREVESTHNLTEMLKDNNSLRQKVSFLQEENELLSRKVATLERTLSDNNIKTHE